MKTINHRFSFGCFWAGDLWACITTQRNRHLLTAYRSIAVFLTVLIYVTGLTPLMFQVTESSVSCLVKSPGPWRLASYERSLCQQMYKMRVCFEGCVAIRLRELVLLCCVWFCKGNGVEMLVSDLRKQHSSVSSPTKFDRSQRRPAKNLVLNAGWIHMLYVNTGYPQFSILLLLRESAWNPSVLKKKLVVAQRIMRISVIQIFTQFYRNMYTSKLLTWVPVLKNICWETRLIDWSVLKGRYILSSSSAYQLTLDLLAVYRLGAIDSNPFAWNETDSIVKTW